MLEKDAVCVFIKKAKNMSELAGEAEKSRRNGHPGRLRGLALSKLVQTKRFKGSIKSIWYVSAGFDA